MYPSRNTSTYSAPTRNSSIQQNQPNSSFNFLLIDDFNFLLIDDNYKLQLDSVPEWTYQTKT